MQVKSKSLVVKKGEANTASPSYILKKELAVNARKKKLQQILKDFMDTPKLVRQDYELEARRHQHKIHY